MNKTLLHLFIYIILLYNSNIYASVLTSFAHSYALVIGINAYSSPRWNKLSFATKDAEAVASYLVKQGFTVTLLKDEKATRENILSYFDNLSIKLTENDRFLFYFSGHGTTETIDGKQFGYLVPFGNVSSTAALISTEDIKSQSQRIGRVKHQLYIINSCYGGLLGILRSGAIDSTRIDYIEQITKLPAREFISAGGPDQKVLDGGPSGLSWFTYYLLEALDEGKADLVADNIITFSELSAYLVPRASNDYQTPAWGVLYGHGLGEFVFDKLGTPANTVFTNNQTYSSKLPRQNVSRGEQTIDINEIRKPIDNIYMAWEELDLELYLKQWSPDSIQYLPKSKRNFEQIKEKRKNDFDKYSKVEVLGYQVHYISSSANKVTLAASYDMNFHLKNGRIIKEHGVLENYTLSYSEQAGQWLIIENRDYLGRK